MVREIDRLVKRQTKLLAGAVAGLVAESTLEATDTRDGFDAWMTGATLVDLPRPRRHTAMETMMAPEAQRER